MQTSDHTSRNSSTLMSPQQKHYFKILGQDGPMSLQTIKLNAYHGEICLLGSITKEGTQLEWRSIQK